MILLYFLLVFIFSLFSYLFVDTNLFYFKNIISGFYLEHRFLASFLYFSLVTFFFLFYLLFLKQVRNKTLNKGKLKKIIIGTLLILFFSYPAILSYDIFNYFATAKVAFIYNENPYILMPIEFTNEPLLEFMQAANKTALYGPFWIILTTLPVLLGLGNFVATVFGLKLLVAVFYFLTSYLIYKMSKSMFSLSFFALNPLVLIETLVGSHNDIVMMFFALFSIYLLKNKKILIALVLLFLSILIKFATVFLIPVFIYVILKRIKKEEINWYYVFSLSAVFMFIIFILSVFREEIYPWYGIWFLVFVALIKNKLIQTVSILLSFGLLLKYIPFMLIGTHFGVVPYLKFAISFTPALVFILFFYFRKWLKKLSL